MSENTNDMASDNSNINIYQHQQQGLDIDDDDNNNVDKWHPAIAKKKIYVAVMWRNEQSKMATWKKYHVEKRKRKRESVRARGREIVSGQENKIGRNETLQVFRSSMVNFAFIVIILICNICISSSISLARSLTYSLTHYSTLIEWISFAQSMPFVKI